MKRKYRILLNYLIILGMLLKFGSFCVADEDWEKDEDTKEIAAKEYCSISMEDVVKKADIKWEFSSTNASVEVVVLIMDDPEYEEFDADALNTESIVFQGNQSGEGKYDAPYTHDWTIVFLNNETAYGQTTITYSVEWEVEDKSIDPSLSDQFILFLLIGAGIGLVGLVAIVLIVKRKKKARVAKKKPQKKTEYDHLFEGIED